MPAYAAVLSWPPPAVSFIAQSVAYAAGLPTHESVQEFVHEILPRLTEVDEQRNVHTKATFGDAVNAWMRMHAVNENTLAANDALARRYRCRRGATSG